MVLRIFSRAYLPPYVFILKFLFKNEKKKMWEALTWSITTSGSQGWHSGDEQIRLSDILSSSHVNEVSPVVSHGFVFIASIQKSISKLQANLYVIRLIMPLRKSVLRIALQFKACHGELSIFVECLLEDRHWPVPCSADGWDTVKELMVL